MQPGGSAVVLTRARSIVYDQPHEVGTMAAEQGGAVKKAEGIRWLARYVRAPKGPA